MRAARCSQPAVHSPAVAVGPTFARVAVVADSRPSPTRGRRRLAAVADALNALAAVANHRSMPERPIVPTRSTVTSRGIDCVLWTWPVRQPKGTVVVYHGLGAHARFPSVRLVAELLAARSYRVCAMDLPGHGESPGLRGYIDSADALIVDGIRAATAAATPSAQPGPVFLLGSSMGGAIAVQVASALAAMAVKLAGLVLLAPMLGPAAGTPARLLLQALAWTPLARVPLIPSSATDNRKQYSDEAVLREVAADALAYKGKLRVASAAAVVDLGHRTEANLETVAAPFFCLVADREMVLGPRSRAAAERLMQVAATPPEHRAHKSYDALHGILCEPPEKRERIAADIVSWMDARCSRV
jgi:acylglycerol lipase